MTYSEAGKLGALVSKVKIKLKHKLFVEQYYCSPKKCKHCFTVISFEKRANNFCCHSCAAIFNNKTVDIHCMFCNKKMTGKNKYLHKYCGRKCFNDHRWQLYKEEIICHGKVSSPSVGRKYLIELNGNVCEICKRTEWMGQPIPLTLDHKNGNPEDHSLVNLRMICPNCDRQTPTFGSRNRGNGRFLRRQRRAEGKSH